MTRPLRLVAAMTLVLALTSACATIFEGNDHTITVSTKPPGARCDIKRESEPLATIHPTPGSIKIDKSKNDLTISCTKDGYAPASVTSESRMVGTTLGNVGVGLLVPVVGVIGLIADAASGANFTYPPLVEIELTPNDSVVAAAPAGPAATPTQAPPPAPRPVPN
jgi:hypothetical protein